MTTIATFRLTIPKDDVAKVLKTAYRMEVDNRHRVFIPSDGLDKVIDAVADCLTRDSHKFGILFTGLSGNGKTTLLHSTAQTINACIDQQFTTLPIAKRMSIYDADNILKIAKLDSWDDFKNLRILAIDDLGKESTDVSTYGNISSPMIELLEYRYKRGLYTIISTNLTPKDISEKYGKRIGDRFKEMFEVIIFKEDSFRR